MPRYVILVPKSGAEVTFAYMDPERALKKTRTLQRAAGTEYALLADERPITDAQLEADAVGSGK